MNLDRHTLNLAAAVLCGLGGVAALIDGLSGGFRKGGRASLLSGLLATVGSTAWALSAYKDLEESRNDADLA